MIKESFDGQNALGEWRPQDTALPPLFRWPLKPLEIIKWFVGFPGYCENPPDRICSRRSCVDVLVNWEEVLFNG